MNYNFNRNVGISGEISVNDMKVSLNGTPFSYPAEAIKTMGELVELVKSNIDPDTIIIDLRKDGKILSDNDWRQNLSSQSDASLEIRTGSKKDYIEERLSSASLYLDKIIRSFAQARLLFKNAEIQPANTELSKAVSDMKAFIEWYQTILEMVENPPEQEVEVFEKTVTTLSETCEQILQQQLYRSWWAIAESLEKKLEPQLEQLKFACLGVFRTQGTISNN
jgi:hypothetical protein